jgi:hypothetical protein
MLLDHRDLTMIVFTLLATALVFGVVRSNLHMTFFGVVRNPQEVLATLNASHNEVSSSAAAAAAAPAGRSSSSSSVFYNNVTEPRSSRTDSQAFNISGCSREPVVAPLKNNSSEGLDHHHHHHVFQYMSATYNNMTDDELLWMATRISMRSRGAPPKQHTPGRIAFMFLIRGPLPFARLWERYFFGHERLYSVYVHAHPSYVPDDVPLSSPFYGRFIRSEVCVGAKSGSSLFIFFSFSCGLLSWILMSSWSSGGKMGKDFDVQRGEKIARECTARLQQRVVRALVRGMHTARQFPQHLRVHHEFAAQFCTVEFGGG